MSMVTVALVSQGGISHNICVAIAWHKRIVVGLGWQPGASFGGGIVVGLLVGLLEPRLSFE